MRPFSARACVHLVRFATWLCLLDASAALGQADAGAAEAELAQLTPPPDAPALRDEGEPGGRAVTLRQAQESARKFHPRILGAQDETNAAHQDVRVSQAKYYPNVVFEAVAAESNPKGAIQPRIFAGWSLAPPPVASRVAFGVQLRQIVTDFGRTRHRVATDKLLAKSRRDEADATDAEVVLQASMAYHQLVQTQEVLRVAHEVLAARNVVLQQVSALRGEGLKSTVDVSFAKVSVEDAQILLVQAQQAHDAARAILVAAMGGHGSDDLDASDKPSAPALPDVQYSFAHALSLRPDLQSLRTKLQASRASVSAEKAGYLPKIELIGNLNYLVWIQQPQVDQRFLRFNAMAGVVLDVPLFQGFEVMARTEHARQMSGVAQQRLSESENNVLRDLRVAWAQAKAAHDVIATAQERARDTRVGVDAAQARYNEGLGTIVELTQAQSNLARALVEEVDALVSYQERLTELDYQMGVLR